MYNIDFLDKLISSYKNNKEYYVSSRYNESACRLNYIDNLLKVLGWDVSNDANVAPQLREVLVEDYEKNTGRPDYSMTLSGVVKFFVEAKKPSVDVNTNYNAIFQARSYGWSAKHKIVVLTNFENLLIYDTSVMPSFDDTPDTALIAKYNYSDYVNKFDEISSLISKEFVYSGEFDNSYTENKGQQKHIDEVFLNQINSWRIDLGEYLFGNGFDIDIINDMTQEFINQIVFLRICEDRNLPIYHTLLETIKDETSVKDKLNELFVRADRNYNSGLFKGDYLIFDVENEIIINIIKTLYYPQSPYVFNLIDAGLLGQIYELFLVKHLIVDDDGHIQLCEKKANQNRSVVTTPVEIVKYMTTKSVNELLIDKTPKEMIKLRIADISSGSGIFLTEAYEQLLMYAVDWYLQNKPEYLIPMGGDIYKLPFKDKKEILVSCIFGVDIDPHAVEVSKFSLLIKLLEGENKPTVEGTMPILPDISKNIQVGNSLIDTDMINKYKAEDQIEFIVPFDWSQINDGEKFDLIIGNPPYVKSEDMKSLLPSKERLIYGKYYKSAYRQFDKYFIFIERALELTKDKGILSYIVSNKFSKIKSGIKLRELLANNYCVKEFIDFGSAQLFDDKTIYSSIIFIENVVNNTGSFIFREVEDVTQWWITKDDSSKIVELNRKFLSESPWVLVSDLELVAKLNKLYTKSIPLRRVAIPFVGIQTSAERIKLNGFKNYPAYWFTDEDVVSETKSTISFERYNKKFSVEKDILKRYFKPVGAKEKGNSSYDICTTNKWIIFPYDRNGDVIPLKTMHKRYPKTLKYLKFIYKALEPKQLGGDGRRDVPQATEDTWYRYGRHQSFTNFWNTDKLIVGVMSKKSMYMRDKNNYVVASGDTAGYVGIREKSGSQYSLEFIQAYLSHPLIETVLSIIGSDFEGGFYSRGKSVLDVVPVKEIDFNNTVEKQRHDTIVNKTKEIYKINDKLVDKIPKKDGIVLERRKKQLIREIKLLVDEILV